jgi:multiple sugar transport system substrate-binding protein
MRPFETGRYAMALLQADVQSYKDASFNWDIAMPPKGPAGRKVLRYAAAFAIPQTSEHPEAAWEFLRWLVQDMPAHYTNQLFYGQVPNSRRLASSPEYLEGEPTVNRQVIVDLVENYSFSYWRSKWEQFRDQGFLPELDLMLLGEKSVAQGAADASKRIDEVLAQ